MPKACAAIPRGGRTHFTFIVAVFLVASEGDNGARAAVIMQLVNPGLGLLKGLGGGDVVYDESSSGAAVIHRRERAVALLPGCVPDLEFHSRVVRGGRKRLSHECRAYRRLLVLVELVLTETQRYR